MELTIILICLVAALVLLFRVVAHIGRHAGMHRVEIRCGCPATHTYYVDEGMGIGDECPVCHYKIVVKMNAGRITAKAVPA